jgi:hypothetical protein
MISVNADEIFANPDMPKLLGYYSALTDEKKKKFEKSLNQEEKVALYYGSRGVAAKEYPIGVEGFRHYFWCMTGFELAPYALEKWLPAFVRTYYEKRGTMLMGFRGSGKSFYLFHWSGYVEGKNPVGSTMFVKISGDSAKETASLFSNIVENSPRWKFMFPHVVPDDKRWNLDGYDLRDTTVDYGRWVDMRSRDHLSEPSFLCAGVDSGIIIGKHPTNGSYFDDLHDEKNTRSAREMEAVKAIFTSDIVPTWNRPNGHPPLGVACTPWAEDDVYSVMLKTGKFDLVKTPIFERDENGDAEFEGNKVKLAWKEAYPIEKIKELYEVGPTQFARMYQVDLTALKGTVLKKEWIHEFPREKINTTWSVFFGIDFASSADKMKDGKRDYFAMAIGVGVPGVGVVLIDGVREHLSTEESLQLVRSKAALYPNLQIIGIEKYGKGEEFFNLCRAQLGIKILPCPLDGTAPKSKGQRYQGMGGLETWFFNTRAWISDVRTPFIDSFVDEWIGWDGERTRSGHDDCLDAVYWLLYVSQQYLVMPSMGESIGVRVRRPSVFASLGDKHGKVA